ncbi:hypothetical protein GCM10009106_11730 [Sphingomonas japonica]
MSSAVAYAGQSTRSGSALPTAKAQTAPVSGVRSSANLKKKSNLGAEGAVIGVAAAAAIGLGIYVAVDEEDGPEVDSPG